MSNRSSLATGFTLVEVLVAIAIFIVVMISVSFFEANIFIYNRSISGSYTTAQDAQVLLRTMNRELRTMTASNDGSYALVQAGTSSVTFFSDLKSDGSKERVRYYLYKGALYKGVIQPTGSPATYPLSAEASTTLVSNVKNSASTPVFEYFNGSYDGTTAALAQPVNVGAVRLIKINISLDIDPNRSPVPQMYSTQVSLRNLKDNL
jgi:prepilin-type N-terminal cleavage/methylation domain-containing protein